MEVLDLNGLKALAQKINQKDAVLVSDIQKAALAAHSAADKADEAATTAQSAASNVQTALTKAQQAANLADKLQDRLIVAEDNAASATSMADTAKATADNARTAASNASTTATNARTIANNAKTTAEQAAADIEVVEERMTDLEAKVEEKAHIHFLPFAGVVTLSATTNVAQTGIAGGVSYDVVFDTRHKAFMARIRTSVSRIVPGEDVTGNVIYAYGDCMVDYNTDNGSGTPWPQQLYMDADNNLWCFSNGELVSIIKT